MASSSSSCAQFQLPSLLQACGSQDTTVGFEEQLLVLGPQSQVKELSVPVALQGGPSSCTLVTLPSCHLGEINRTSLPR